MKNDYEPIEFPKDELRHDCITEWWYFNGNLKDKNDHEYSYMNCLFKAEFPKVTKDFLHKFPSKVVYFYHSIVTDVKENKFYPHIDYLVEPSKDSFCSQLLNIYFAAPHKIGEYRSYYIEEPEIFNYRVKGEKINLDLKSKKKPLLEGQTGYVENIGKATYYYSLTNLETKGAIEVDGKIIPVTGKSWMDHQWANVGLSKDFWNWFSIQLDNQTEIVCYQYGNSEKSNFLATLSYPDGSQKSYADINLVPLNKVWKGKVTKATYPVEWNLEIPEEKINLNIKAKVTNHEMNYLNINYWESPTYIKGKIKDKEIGGIGYMELVGRPSILNDPKFFAKKLKEKLLKSKI